MSDRRDRDRDRSDRDRDRRHRSRSPRGRDRDRDRRDRRDRDRDRRERRDRDRTDEDRAEAKKADDGVQNNKLTALASQLEEEVIKRRERAAQWRKDKERHEARLKEAKEQLEKEKEDNDEPQEGVFVDENDEVEEVDSGENSDDELDEMEVDVNGTSKEEDDDEEEDPLDAYMAVLDKEIKRDNKPKVRRIVISEAEKASEGPAKGEIIDNEDEPNRVLEDFDMGEEMNSLMARSKHLEETDHTKVYYKDFKKDFYHEVPDLQKMTKEEVDQYRATLDNIAVRGKRVPKPIKNWAQAGLNVKVMNVLKKIGRATGKLNYQKPTSIQAQAVPAILSGRDVIGIAKTGSGKTLAFLLPMFRHILDQEPLDEMDGPIGIVLSPTRELAMQTYKEARKFATPLGLRVVCVYGGVGISDQIADLKKGAEIIVCTPGRMIDMLAANAGKVTNLRRVTYLVMDEADRMFDMGFEPQVMKIVNNIRPDRQTVLFSATFPKRMEGLARKILKLPVEIQVGGKSIVCADVNQHALVVDEHVKLLKLLELLGQYYELGSVLVFVEKQEKADEVVVELMRSGYNCAPLHGGIDQFDRDSRIIDFKSGRLKVLVATSVAARGLDVKDLILVVNYDCPNHYEDYVHRVGRTGRAGNQGYAYTFILPLGQERLAGEVCRAFETAGIEPPADVKALFDKFKEEQEAEGKTVVLGGGGYSGSGFKYDEAESEQELSKRMFTKLVHGIEAGADEDDEAIEEQLLLLMKSKSKVTKRDAIEDPFGFGKSDGTAPSTSAAPKDQKPLKPTKEQLKEKENKAAAARAAAERIAKEKQLGAIQVAEKDATAVTAEAVLRGERAPELKLSASSQAKQIAERLNNRLNYLPSAIHPSVNPDFHTNYFEEEVEINDFPQQIRYKICSRESIAQVEEFANVGISVKGTHYPPNKEPKEGQDRKLYLLLQARDEPALRRAKEEIIRIMREQLRASLMQGRPPTGGRYQLF
ncbi:unnamed protein product [Bursaphelenchus okinawaensis]|uniref:Probable ATP-dependent RNA helicase DDX46 n=1 Tax=Bursaphelenchus okinawaensis TaxID=465554 RepID=A0A811L1B1_9BILA|nr:unnamed protein product [Bursaphelenchus okinawaensis]CAG9115168.1 unnamed protein product [Bursaphelenchus okinawaensis]